MEWLLVPVGLAAGALSTIAGLGGGILVVLFLSVLVDPRTALVASAPALLAGNVHRMWLFRHALEKKIALSFIAGAVPGALLGSLAVVVLPDGALAWILFAVSLCAAAREVGWIRWTPKPTALAPAGFGAGTIAATSGGGILVYPVLIAAGVKGDTLIATAAATAVAFHMTRLIGYGIGGLVHVDVLPQIALLIVGLCAGNIAGRKLRERMSDRAMMRASYAVLAVMIALAAAGVL
jgi:uncharacterized protein